MEHAETLGSAERPATARPVTDHLAIWVLGAGLLAGAMTWLVGEATVATFRPKMEVMNTPAGRMTGATVEEVVRTDVKNATLAFVVQGACLGLAMGLAGGLARHSAGAGIGAGVAGGILGAALAFGASAALQPVYYSNRELDRVDPGLTVPMLVHGGIWGAVGLAGGLAFGLGRGGGPSSIARTAVGGLIGGVLAACLFEATAAMAFPEAATTRPLSRTSGSRLMARMMVALLAAAGIVALVGGGGTASVSPGTAPAGPEPEAGPPAG